MPQVLKVNDGFMKETTAAINTFIQCRRVWKVSCKADGGQYGAMMRRKRMNMRAFVKHCEDLERNDPLNCRVQRDARKIVAKCKSLLILSCRNHTMPRNP